MKKIGIACASGTFKGVFTHGVLAAFEKSKFTPMVIGCSSSSTASGCFFVAKEVQNIGVDYWKDVVTMRNEGISMSEITNESIKKYGDLFKGVILKSENAPYLSIATSHVINEEAAEKTQTEAAKRFGRKLLLSAMKKDRTWVDNNLSTVYFSNKFLKNNKALTNENFEEVLYATTRMLHEWDEPAWIDGQPYIDASYTCSCMVEEMQRINCDLIIAIGTEPNGLFTDLFMKNSVEENKKIKMILPDYNLKTVGVDFTQATIEGIDIAYEHGYEKGLEFITRYKAPAL